jgi:hypothetical protein
MEAQNSSSRGLRSNLMHKLVAVAETSVQIFAALAAFIFLISGVVYLSLGPWTVIMHDFWRFYDFGLNHTWLESAMLKDQHHSLFFPSFFWLTDLRFFHGDQLLLFFAGIVLLFITVTLILMLVWRDKTVGLTAKAMATLVVIVGNFWMVRGLITASAGFNVIYSLVVAGAALAFLLVPKMCGSSTWFSSATLIVVCAGFVAFFSFGTGLAIWPTLLFLAWGLRLPWRAFLSLGVAAVAATIIYQQLPTNLAHFKAFEAAGSAGAALVAQFCRLAGSPFFYAVSGWHPKRLPVEEFQSSALPLWWGGMGLAIAVVAMSSTMIRRDLIKSNLKLIGMALVTFNFVAMALIVVGRADRFLAQPLEAAGPRFLFWSTLFWTGLLLMAIQCAESTQWLRWPVYLVALALPILALPEHYRDGLHLRFARQLTESAATSLINGVRDEQSVKILAGIPKLVYDVAEQLRARRLAMFADGLQDWIGLEEESLFGGRCRAEKLKGRCSVVALVQCDNGAPAARVVGQALKQGHAVPKTLVMVDPSGVVRGVARSSPMNRFINRTFYLGKVNTDRFLGYIRDYNPQLRYTVRSADDRTLSEEKIPVRVGMTKPAKR